MHQNNGSKRRLKRQNHNGPKIETVNLSDVVTVGLQQLNVHLLVRHSIEPEMTWRELKLSLQFHQQGVTKKIGWSFHWPGGKGLRPALECWLASHDLPPETYQAINQVVNQLHQQYEQKPSSVSA